MPGRALVLGLPERRAENVRSAAAGPPSTTVPAGVDPAAAGSVGMALRVPAFVIVTLALGLGAHLAAGGGLPSPDSAVLIAVLLAIAGRLFALREQSLPRLTAMVWSVQGGIHFVLMTGCAGAEDHLAALRLGGHHLHLQAGGPRVGTVAVQGAGLVTSGLPGRTTTSVAASAADTRQALLMLTLHAVAGLAVAAWLRRGEAATFGAARRILPRLLPHRATLPVRPAVPRTLPVWDAPARPHQRLACLSTPRRGPPSLAF